MKRIIILTCTLSLAVFSLPLQAQMDEQAAQKAWMDYMTPGEVQKMLAKADGEWTSETTFWMAPGGPPTKSTGNATNKMILGGRYQESKHTGNMMGMPFEGIGVTGYDNVRKMFVSSWVDNMGTGMMFMEGKWDPATKTVTFTGKSTDPMTGKEMDIRETVTFVNDNTQKMEMYTQVDGKEFKMMEINLTRK